MRSVALALVVLALPLLPLVEAQLPAQPVNTSMSVILVDSGKPAALERPTLVAIQLRYQWTAGGAAAEATRIELAVEEAPTWAVDAHVEPANLTAQVQPGFTTYAELNATLNFTAPAGAPAYQTGNFTVVARAAPNGNLAASEGRGVYTTRPDFVGNLSLVVEPAVATGGSWSPIPVRVANLGNGGTDVAISVVIKPEPSEVQVPPPIRLAVGEATTVEVLLRLPWTTGVDGALKVSATGTSAVNPRAEPVVVEHETFVDGRTPVPLPTWAPLAALGIALLLLAARRPPR